MTTNVEQVAPMSTGSAAEAKDIVQQQENDQSEVEVEPATEVVIKKVRKLDMNSYATRKTIGLVLLDLALLVANMEKMKSVIAEGHTHLDFYYFVLVMLVIIAIVQLGLAFILLYVGKLDLTDKTNHWDLDVWNSIAIIAIVAVTVLQIITSSFGAERPAH
ncbi:PREDICTED: ninjurin-1-like [Priapulus caudatus]|uniref:Ninjurin-1-like n=1 Tax=Priapulus caudatus TaxID=37621 RepID=A0ABM1EA35_PRICU|nr:PREDICTED: ninjurin-1-like [Priapulus caudatus]XP_014669056.1 PREDICTED: ninjurin-1-like [Priapulus caudatus]